MTLPLTANTLVSIAKQELGTHENPPGSNKQKYGLAYGLNGAPWCAIFVWWCFNQAGYDLKTIAPQLHYTPAFVASLASAGWPSVKYTDARRGDILFFDFPDSVNRIQHVGILHTPTGNGRVATLTIEGNTSLSSDDNGGEVMLRSRGASVVKRIIRPPYKPVRPTGTERILNALPVVKRGSANKEAIQSVQGLLVARSHPEVLVNGKLDGVFGPTTERAVKAVQRWGNIDDTGIVDLKTWAVLLRVK